MFEILLLKNFGFKNLTSKVELKSTGKLVTFKMWKGVILTVKKNKAICIISWKFLTGWIDTVFVPLTNLCPWVCFFTLKFEMSIPV